MKYMGSFGVVTTGALFVLGLAAYGCGPDSSDPEEGNTGGSSSGGSEATGGDEAAGGDTGNTGGGSTDGGAGSGSGGGASDCPAVSAALLTDFSEMTPGDSWSHDDTARSFGLEGVTGVSGGTFHYRGTEDTVLTAMITEDPALSLSGTIAANDYAGFGFWFPNTTEACSDASQYTGISFNFSGDVGNTQVQVQLQHRANYPIEGDKGACEFTSEDTKWSECTNNTVTLEGETGVIELPFADFTGGTPEPTLNPAELVGLQWQFNCGDETCSPDLTLDDITFY